MLRSELEKWQEHLVGKACPIHTGRLIRNGKFGLWCGAKDDFGRWCDGGSVSQEFLTNLRKEQVWKE